MKNTHLGPKTPQFAPLPRRMTYELNRLLQQSAASDTQAALDVLTRSPQQIAQTLSAPHAIVVLGAPANNDGSLSAALAVRVCRAAQLAQQHPQALVVVTGGAVANSVNEAHTMATELRRLGVPQHRLLIEPHARITAENALCCYELLRQAWGSMPSQPGLITLVTEPFHGPRSLRLFDKIGKKYGEPWVLRFAPAAKSGLRKTDQVPWRSQNGAIVLTTDFRKHLEICIEEQRRISVGF